MSASLAARMKSRINLHWALFGIKSLGHRGNSLNDSSSSWCRNMKEWFLKKWRNNIHGCILFVALCHMQHDVTCMDHIDVCMCNVVSLLYQKPRQHTRKCGYLQEFIKMSTFHSQSPRAWPMWPLCKPSHIAVPEPHRSTPRDARPSQLRPTGHPSSCSQPHHGKHQH